MRGDNMIQEFVSGAYRYTLASPSLVLSKVKINNVDISKYLSNESQVGWYDVSKDSGRDTTTANGKMILNVIATKYRLDLVTRPLTRDEMVDFFSQIRLQPTMTVQFLDPFDNTWKTKSCYRGDRTAQANRSYLMKETNNNVTTDVLVELFNPVNIAIIEL
jgi:hypothetical protein